VRVGDPERSGNQSGACDDESERDHPSRDRERLGPDRITEDQDGAKKKKCKKKKK
jgi:hypothetical protein